MRIPAYHMAGRRVAAAPTISIAGTMLIGGTLTATAADTTSYQWYRATTLIGGATLSTYVVTDSDIGPPITCRATGPGGETESNALIYDDAGHLPFTAIGVSNAGLTHASGTVSAWAASLGGIACTLAAPAPTNEPAYAATGGALSRPLITFDGTDDVLRGTVTKGSDFASYEWGIAGKRVAFGSVADAWIGYENAGAQRFWINDSSTSAWRATVAGGANVVSTGADPDVALGHYSCDAASGTINARTNGTVVGTAAAVVTSRADGGDVALGANSSGGAAANIAVQAWYIGEALTATQRTHLRALLTYWTGIAC